MNNPTTAELVEVLRGCVEGTNNVCGKCPVTGQSLYGCQGELMLIAADLIEQLQRELEDERYRHDRYADYCVAADEERSALKERARWIPVEERLPEDEGEKIIKYGFVHDGELDDRRFMSAGCYYLHDTVPHWRNEGYAGMKVTHWMDPPPEE